MGADADGGRGMKEEERPADVGTVKGRQLVENCGDSNRMIPKDLDMVTTSLRVMNKIAEGT